MKIILCFSHKLNDIQLLELKNRYDISNSKDIIYLPQDLQFVWSNVSENSDIYSNNYNKIKNFIKATANENDLILIQGEWGYTYNLVTYCKKHHLTPIYSFSIRNSKEIIKNNISTKTSIFEHVKFKEY